MKFEIKDKDIIWLFKKLGIKSRKLIVPVAAFEEFLLRLEKNHSFLLAAGIAFNILLYLIPLLLVALYVVNLTIGVETISDFLIKTFDNVLPNTPIIKDVLESTISEVHSIFEHSSLFGIIGIITLLWLSSILLSSLRTGLNTVFNIETPKTYFIYKLKDIFLIIAIALLVMILSFISPMLSVIQSYILDLFPDELSGLFDKLYIFGFSIFSSFLLFYLLFRFVPNKKMPRFIRLISILSCMFFLETSRHIFSWYITGVSAYGKFYGTYAILASMAIWVYYLTFIILFSAELGKFVYDIKSSKDST